MHEVGIIQNTLAMALKQAEREGARHIHALRMRVGVMSGVVRDALDFAFEVAVKGTLAEGARLVVEDVPVGCLCRSCRREFEPLVDSFECPSCHGTDLDLCHGREIELASLEVS
jgi:hydrogenase nickel incorporation protein HypA/HybF